VHTPVLYTGFVEKNEAQLLNIAFLTILTNYFNDKYLLCFFFSFLHPQYTVNCRHQTKEHHVYKPGIQCIIAAYKSLGLDGNSFR